MTNASGVAKQVRYKVESAFGTAPGASGAQLLRRVKSGLGLKKDTYQSAEIRSDYQIADFRHGLRRVSGALNGELSPGTYKDFIAAALRKAFAAVSPITGLSITVSGSGPTYTVARASGSWLTDGVKIGQVGRLTAGSLNAANLNKNLLPIAVTASNLTVMPLNGVALVAEGPIASCTWTPTGKQTYVPTSGHTDNSFAIEHWYSDINQSELYTGCKVNKLDIALPPTGMATIDLDFIGKDLVTATSQYYTSPTAATSTGIVAAVNGILVAGGSAIAIATGMNISIDGGYSADPVIGSNTVPAITPGRVNITGQFSAYFADGTLRDNFINEDEISLIAVLTASNAANADFIGFTVPRIKLGDAARDDGEKSIVATFPYQALFNSAGGAGISSEQTTLVVQDSQA